MMSLQKRPIKVRNLKPISLLAFFFALALEKEKRIFIKTLNIEGSCVIGQGNIQPGNLQAGAVKELTQFPTCAR